MKRFRIENVGGHAELVTETPTGLPNTAGGRSADHASPRNDAASSISPWRAASEDAGRRLREPNFVMPKHYTPTYRYPLVIHLHGEGNNQREINQLFPHISAQNFVYAGIRGQRCLDADATRFGWGQSDASAHRTSADLLACIDEAKKRFSIHADRVVLIGRESGGEMAMRMAMEHPQTFAAVVSIGGSWPRFRLSDWHALRRRRLPLLWQWGREDPTYSRDARLKDCRASMLMGMKVEIREYPGDGEPCTTMLSDINHFLMGTLIGEDIVSDHSSLSDSLYQYN